MASTRIADAVVPENFTPYTIELTKEKSRLVQAGVVGVNAQLSADLNGGGMTFNISSWNDIQNEEERVGSDDDAAQIPDTGGAAPNNHKKITSNREVVARLSRNQSWSHMDLTTALAGSNPGEVVAQNVGGYWARRLQAAVVATINGVVADNVANDGGDYVHDISVLNGGVFADGVTNFSAEAYIDAKATMGDSADQTSVLMVHSVVKRRMEKNNLIDFIPDARGETEIPTFLGAVVIEDDGMPSAGGVFTSWLMGAGFLSWGISSPEVPTEIDRIAKGANGSGQEVLYNRVEWAIHPSGHAIQGVTNGGGPTNAVLATAASWDRVFPERKQIPLAVLNSREF